jgi:hypothetical protein
MHGHANGWHANGWHANGWACKCWEYIDRCERTDGHANGWACMDGWACKFWDCIDRRERTDEWPFQISATVHCCTASVLRQVHDIMVLSSKPDDLCLRVGN